MSSFFDDHSTPAIPNPPPIKTAVAPPRLIRICLLVNGHFSENPGDMYDIYLNWLNASLPENTNVKFKLDPYETQEQKYPTREEIEHYDALLLSGSPSDAWGDDEWVSRLVMFTQKVANEYPKIRIYGVCFGSQIVGRALGGDVKPNDGTWEIGVTNVRTTWMGKLLFGVEQLNLLQFHSDHVVLNSLSDYLAPGDLYLLGSTQRTTVQGLVKFYQFHEQTDDSNELIKRVHIMTTQGHPEFTEKTVTEILRRRHGNGEVSDAGHEEYFGTKGHTTEIEPVIKKDTGKRWIKHYDGIRVIGRSFWRMLGVEFGPEHPAKVPV